mmetsp:Transcript_17259/g.35254  ORF Transcript_17259/g.35254 Transcript_17259/m.35254 type:complete len:507 (-) Transcript_17259:98-1618(-)
MAAGAVVRPPLAEVNLTLLDAAVVDALLLRLDGGGPAAGGGVQLPDVEEGVAHGGADGLCHSRRHRWGLAVLPRFAAPQRSLRLRPKSLVRPGGVVQPRAGEVVDQALRHHHGVLLVQRVVVVVVVVLLRRLVEAGGGVRPHVLLHVGGHRRRFRHGHGRLVGPRLERHPLRVLQRDLPPRERRHARQVDHPDPAKGLVQRHPHQLVVPQAHVPQLGPLHVHVVVQDHRLPRPHLEAVLRRRQHRLASRVELNRPHARRLRPRRLHDAKGVQVPELDGAVERARGQKVLVRVEAHLRDGVGVVLELVQELARGEVPDPQQPFLVAGDDPLAVGAELDLGDPPVVALVGVDAHLLAQVPDLEVGVERAGREELAERVIVEGEAVGAVAREGAHDLGLLEVPRLDRAARGARQDRLLAAVEHHALHGALVPGQAQQRVRLAHRPHVDLAVLPARHQDPGVLAAEVSAVHVRAVRRELLQPEAALRRRAPSSVMRHSEVGLRSFKPRPK